MKEKLLLVGAGGFGRVALEQAQLKYDCTFVDDNDEDRTEICNVPIIGHISDLSMLRKSYHLLIVCIGNNILREQIYQKAMQMDYTFPNIICPTAYVSPFAQIGWGCILLNNTVVQNGARIGNGVLLNPGVELHHDSTVGDYGLIYTNSVIRTQAKLGKRVRIGSNVTISNAVTVSDDADIKNGVALF